MWCCGGPGEAVSFKGSGRRPYGRRTGIMAAGGPDTMVLAGFVIPITTLTDLSMVFHLPGRDKTPWAENCLYWGRVSSSVKAKNPP